MQQVKSADADMPARAALRDLLWRVEHMRDLLLDDAGAIDPRMVQDLLDTGEARRAIGLPVRATEKNVSYWLPGGGAYAAEVNTEE